MNDLVRTTKGNTGRAWTLVLCLAAIPLASYCYVSIARAEDMPNTSSKLEAFRWLTGTWVGKDNPDLYEVWTDPIDDAMIGIFRWTKKNKLWMTEHLSITVDEGVPVFRLRHFARDMVAWEDKNGALTYPLTSATNNEIIFENPKRDHPRRFIYRRISHDSYSVTLAGGGNAKDDSDVFEFQRVK